MQYALVDGVKVEAQKGIEGVCIGCGNQMIPKCGVLKMHHWAHRISTKCDSWWETESLWHRGWKSQFPESYREISFYDEKLHEFHRADISTPEGITIEFQNSSLSITEMQSRETFYGKLIWVINGLKFKGFRLGKAIPDPRSSTLDEYEFNGNAHVTYTLKSECFHPTHLKEKYNLEHPILNHIKTTTVHYSFAWKYAHQAWLSSSVPVFIDLGGHFLYWLRKRKQLKEDFLYLQMVKKSDFIKKYCKE